MLRFNLHDFLLLGRWIQDHSTVLMATEIDHGGGGLRPDEIESGLDTLRQLERKCAALDVPLFLASLKRAIADPPKTERELEQLLAILQDELRGKMFLFIPSARAVFYDSPEKNGIPGFPIASSELTRAGNCLAVGEFTACVFHSMRAAEIALRSLAVFLGVSIPVANSSEWANLIEQIEAKVRDAKTMPKSPVKSDLLTLCSEAATQFRYFKDAWRNHVSHSRISYDEGQAQSIFARTTDLVQSLSGKLNEPA